jgi:hypothetical protein
VTLDKDKSKQWKAKIKNARVVTLRLFKNITAGVQGAMLLFAMIVLIGPRYFVNVA